MDAVTYIRERARMCDRYGCEYCPLKEYGDCYNPRDASGAVAIVEQWSKEHPPVTNGEAAVGMMEKMDAPYIRCRKNEVGQVEMILDASWWDAEYKGE